VSAAPDPRGATRRQLLAALAGGGTLAALAGADIASAAAGPIQSQSPGSDAAALAQPLKVEYLLVVAYRRVLASGALDRSVARKVQSQLAQELEHVAALRRALTRLRAPIPAPPRGLVAVQRGLADHHVFISLDRLSTQNECIRLLVDTESVAEGAYFTAISRLSSPALLRMCAEIMGCEAQHWTVLSSARHHGDVTFSVPYPFVGG
jgi:Ferritin-like domain